MKKVLYYIFMILQGTVLAFSVVHSTYCMVTGSVVSIGFVGYPVMFVPFVRICGGGSVWNILAFLAFVFISVYVYIRAFIELLCSDTRKLKFNAINFFWFLLAHFCSLFLTLDETYMTLYSDYTSVLMVSVLLFYLVVVIVKVHDSYDVIRVDRGDGEDFLPEEAQLDAKSYKQIERTAKGMPVIALGCFLVSLYFLYVDLTAQLSVVFINLLYVGTVLILVSNFFICISQTVKFEKTSGQPLPGKDFLVRINVLQITTFILFVASYFLFLIIS